MLRGLKRALALVSLSAVFSAGAYAQTFTEVGDAGATPAAAQAVPGAVVRIEGNLQGPGDVDVYRFTLDSPGLVTIDAWGVEGASPTCAGGYPTIDANLILMDAARLPLWGDDDSDPNHCYGSRIELNLPAGSYYLAFGENNIVAQDAGGAYLCDNDAAGDCALVTTPVDRFGASGGEAGAYVITFSRATGGAAGPVGSVAPVPGPVGLALLPLLLAMGWLGSRALGRRA